MRARVPAVDGDADAGDREVARLFYWVEPLHACSETHVVYIVTAPSTHAFPPRADALITALANNRDHADHIAVEAIQLLRTLHQ